MVASISTTTASETATHRPSLNRPWPKVTELRPNLASREPRADLDRAGIVHFVTILDGDLDQHEQVVPTDQRTHDRIEEADASALAEAGEGDVVDVILPIEIAEAQHILVPESEARPIGQIEPAHGTASRVVKATPSATSPSISASE